MTIAGATDLWRLSALDLATLIRARQVSSSEVVDEHLDRIKTINPLVNAVVMVMADEARSSARAADRRAAAGGDLGPFHGVPFTVKQNIDVAGTPTTQGIAAFARAYPTGDAPVVERMKAAGAIPIGRTNMPSVAVRWHCESELWGPTINPWDPSRTPGASSAGEAVAIATGMSPIGLGNDGLGSLRHPAQCCGICALKPTLGRVPHASLVGPGDASPIGIQLTSVNGPLARRVADLRAVLDVIAGPSWRDPWTVPVATRGPDLGRPVRVALVRSPAGGETDASIQAGVLAAGRALEDAGYGVEEVEPPGVEAAADALLTMLSTPGTRAGWEQIYGPLMPEPTQRFMSAFFAAAGEPDSIAGEAAFMTRHALLRSWSEFQQGHPLIVAPIATEPPAMAGTDLDDGAVAATIRAMRMATAVNALGLPAVAVPVGIADGLPRVVQVIGPRYREDLCLDAAEAVEERVGILTPIEPRIGAAA